MRFILLFLGLLRSSSIRTNDACIHVKGVPKSGTTWLTSLVHDAIAIHCCATCTNRAEIKEPVCSQQCASAAAIREEKHKDTFSSKYRYVVIFRDSRDVAVSKFHWASKGFDEINAFVRGKDGIQVVIEAQNNMLTETKKVDSDKIIWIFYEDLQLHPVRRLGSLLRKLHLDLSRAEVKQVLNMSSFSSMREKEQSGEMHLKVHPKSAQVLQNEEGNLDPTQLNGVMTRRGEIGSWRVEMDNSTQVFSERLMAQQLSPELQRKFLPNEQRVEPSMTQVSALSSFVGSALPFKLETKARVKRKDSSNYLANLTQVAADDSSRSWMLAPIIIGGTGGSGTRGVLETLSKLRIYLVPPKNTLVYKTCINSAGDNRCMALQGSIEENGSTDLGYETWLNNPACQKPTFREQLGLERGGQSYIDSVPRRSRRPLGWGWKIPRTMYQLDKLFAKYPRMVFIHVVRNPLDLAALVDEHLTHRASEFSNLYGGDAAAAHVMDTRCGSFHYEGKCALSEEQLKSMRTCSATTKKECAADVQDNGSWRCMQMMLWAEMNMAVQTFGRHCLEPQHQYVLWHGEDVYGLRGNTNQKQLQVTLAAALQVPLRVISSAFPKPYHRRLGYGKFKETKMNVKKHIKCANSANSEALEFFGYADWA